jgi:hypothetical protein
LIWINTAAADCRYANIPQQRPIVGMSHGALTRLSNLSFISIYVAGLLCEETRRRRREAAGHLPLPKRQGKQDARRLPLARWGGALLLAGWL